VFINECGIICDGDPTFFYRQSNKTRRRSLGIFQYNEATFRLIILFPEDCNSQFFFSKPNVKKVVIKD
jgi:hypothetical protein